MQIVRTPIGTTEVKNIDKVVKSPSNTHTKRIELEHYSNNEMELYLFFQNLGKYPTENPLK